MTKEEFIAFKQLKLSHRYILLLNKGEECGERKFLGNKVKLYTYKGEFFEIWQNLGSGCIHQINHQGNKDILYEYVKRIKI